MAAGRAATRGRGGIHFFLAGDALEEVYGADRVSYLVGSYNGATNYGDIAQLAANVERFAARGASPVLIAASLAHRDAHERFLARHGSFLGRARTLYYALPSRRGEEPELDGAAGDGLLEVPEPPTGDAELALYGGGFFHGRWGWGVERLAVLDALERWLERGVSGSGPRFLGVTGQQVCEDFVRSRAFPRLADLVARSPVFGVRDDLSLELLRAGVGRQRARAVFVSGDDATLLIASLASARSTVAGGVRARRRPSVNVHVSLEPYVTDSADRLLAAGASAVDAILELTDGGVSVNLMTGYEDDRISETRHLERLIAALDRRLDDVRLVELLDEAERGFPGIAGASLTVSCSYHAALTSLLLSVPTLLLYDNDYYRHKHEQLERSFGSLACRAVDVGKGDLAPARNWLATLLRNPEAALAASRQAAESSKRAVLRAAQVDALVRREIEAGRADSLRRRYDETLVSHADALARLSDLQLEYDRALLALARVEPAPQGERRSPTGRGSANYPRLVARLRDLVDRLLPDDASVLVVSRGDDELLKLQVGSASHFPRTPDGLYAGHHPESSEEAIPHLEELRAAGAEYIVFPATSQWWLEHYEGFRDHLERIGVAVLHEDGLGVVYALTLEAAVRALHRRVLEGEQWLDDVRSELRRLENVTQVRAAVAEVIPRGARTLVVSRGDELLLDLAGLHAEHFPQTGGVYAGHHPADGQAAVAHLEELHAQGADFLIVPAPSAWWLDHYREFAAYLGSCCALAWADASCSIYSFRTPCARKRPARDLRRRARKAAGGSKH